MPAMAPFRRGKTKLVNGKSAITGTNAELGTAPRRRRLPRQKRLVATTRATRDATP